jgi:hypothetical protein
MRTRGRRATRRGLTRPAQTSSAQEGFRRESVYYSFPCVATLWVAREDTTGTRPAADFSYAPAGSAGDRHPPRFRRRGRPDGRALRRQRDHELRSTDDTKGIVAAKRRHRGSTPTASAPLAWSGEAPESSGIAPRQGTQRPTSGEFSWGAGTGPVKAAGRLISWVRRWRLGC